MEEIITECINRGDTAMGVARIFFRGGETLFQKIFKKFSKIMQNFFENLVKILLRKLLKMDF